MGATVTVTLAGVIIHRFADTIPDLELKRDFVGNPLVIPFLSDKNIDRRESED